MVDELLSIEESTLNAIAQAIKNKGGTNAPLSFPNGMVSALQAIETEATVTPKITPQQKVLTPSETQFVIEQGFHDGTGTVSVQTQSKSATPSSTQQTITPDAGYFLSSVAVAGIGAGTQVVTGSTTLNSATQLSVTGLSFSPQGIAVVISPDPTAKQYIDQYISVICVKSGFSPYSNATAITNVSASIGNYSVDVTYGGAGVVLQSRGNQRFTGPYKYIVWG